MQSGFGNLIKDELLVCPLKDIIVHSVRGDHADFVTNLAQSDKISERSFIF